MISSRTTIRRGFRFHPSGEELLCHYLEKKNQGSTDSQITHIIPEIDVCKHEPRAVPALVFTMAEFLDNETYYSYTQWYFFSPLHYKYSNSTRSNRTTEQGYWKITGKDLVIMARGSKAEIGRKKTLTFYQRRGEMKPKKTDWVIHEYYRTAKGKHIGGFVLCCLKNKSNKFDHDKDAPFFDGGEPDSGSSSMASNVENQAVMITESAEEFLAYNELEDAVQIPNGKEDTGSCPIDKNELSNCVEGQLDSCKQSDSDMIDELLDDPENLDSLFLQRPPPQPHQLPQPHPLPQPQALLSINGGPRDSFQNNNFIELDDLPSSFEDIGSFLAKFSDTIIDRGSGVSSDRNTEVAHGSDMGKTSILSNIQSWHQTWEVLLEESDCRAASQAKVSEAGEALYCCLSTPEET